MICGVGLGEPAAVDFAPFGEEATPLGRARRLDEGLAILDPLLRGASVTHDGNHYQLHEARIAPACEQSPRMPIWIAAAQPAQAGFRRAARWDGCFPLKFPTAGLGAETTRIDWTQWWLTPREFSTGVELIRKLRAAEESPFDQVASGRTIYDLDDATETLQAYHAAGATWWFEWVKDEPGTFEQTLAAVRRGPPRFNRELPARSAELRHAVQSLHAEIDKAAQGDQQSLIELQRLIVRVEDELSAASATAPLASGLRGLRAQIARLEFAHPRATAILNDISMTLSNLGI
jgi:hypothetical protein